MDLINKLPFFYDNPIITPIQNSFGSEADILHEEVLNTLNQFFIDSATHWLDKWENMLCMKNNNFDIQTRRENIKARIRSRGTTNINTIKNIAESYSNGEVDIIVDNANYSFKIKFIGSLGIPAAFDELNRTINEIKPCHLAHSYEYTYNANSDLSTKTHQQLKIYTHKQLREVKI